MSFRILHHILLKHSLQLHRSLQSAKRLIRAAQANTTFQSRMLAALVVLLTTITLPLEASAARLLPLNTVPQRDNAPFAHPLLAAQPIYQGTVTYQPTALRSPASILATLLKANQVPSDIQPQITISNSDVLNAATDGQNLVITSALLNKLNTNDERAFVISHELSHILLQHIEKTQVRRVGLSLLDSLIVKRYASQGSIAQLASELGIGLIDRRSSRTFEYQADDLGVRLMKQAGYNPNAALRVFDILAANTPPNQVPEFLQDHPITQSRIRSLVQKYQLSE